MNYPFICNCGFNTMDPARAAEHARKHEHEDDLKAAANNGGPSISTFCEKLDQNGGE